MIAILVPFAHHPLVTAIPFVVPVLTLTVAVVVLAVRERRRRESQERGQRLI